MRALFEHALFSGVILAELRIRDLMVEKYLFSAISM
jgi:hypothetical protein